MLTHADVCFGKTGVRCKPCKVADNLDAYKCALFHHNAERSNKPTAQKEDGKAMWWEQLMQRYAGGSGQGRIRKKLRPPPIRTFVLVKQVN
jgi:hypothetical protein